MQRGRIIYLNHDNPEPSGGVKVIYEHAGHLVRNGYNAAVLHQKRGFRPSWFDSDAPLLYLDDNFTLHPDDTLILPEDHAGFIELFRTAPVRKIIFCQNHFYLFEGLKRIGSLQEYGISDLIACSDIVADFLSNTMGFPSVHTLHCAVSPIFRPSPDKKPAIAFMPRKRPVEAQFIQGLSRHLLGSKYRMEWIPLDGEPQSAVARTLSESSIFLSLSRLEGFGLPPLEAMAAGCLVAGFTGFGGLEYASSSNGLWCGEEDPVECAGMLATAVRMLHEESQVVDEIRKEALKTAAAYTPERQERELLQVMRDITGKR